METWIAVILGVCGVAMVALWLSGGNDAESDGQAAAKPAPSKPAPEPRSDAATRQDDDVPESEKPTEVDEESTAAPVAEEPAAPEEPAASEEDVSADEAEAEEPTADDGGDDVSATEEPAQEVAAEEPESATAEVDLSKCTVAELKAMAKERGLTGISRLKKSELIARLSE